ncbi:hypothetical protein HS088_TW03G01098 [Tripterygium wilfordii]|uniref:Protein LURP-one-related 15-like n=1 Tax=Tripterygium wilfordii TaxID=458696 RepID=A0A7J7DWU8_TRIWF|nr:hypothetical protein HS088_TW03G01098 [Tripterygium wilfordii]
MTQPIPAMTTYPMPTNPVVVIGPQFLATYPVDLVVKSKTWSLTEGNFGVTDVNGTVLFSIKGKFFSLRDRRILLDTSGNPLVSLQQKVKGSWLERSCTVYLGNSNTIVAQMHRKHTAASILLDKDCFAVTVYPNVDYAFIVALVVILQEINEDRSGED